MSLGLLDLPGPAFLQLYVVLLAVALIAGMIISHWLRADGLARRIDDPDELALLAGGTPRLVDTVIARLLARDVLFMPTGTSFAVSAYAPAPSDIERSVTSLPAPIGWPAAERALKAAAPAVRRRLIGAGQMMDEADLRQMRLWSMLPLLMLAALGLDKYRIGLAHERPVGFLGGLLILTAILALIRWAGLDPRTRAGQTAVTHARDAAQRLRLAPTRSEMGTAVALFGTGVLIGSAFGDFHRLRNNNDGSGSDGGCGGGGGGCGGCG